MEVGERGVRVRAVGGSRAGEIRITRFLRNPKVSVEEIVSEARRKTLGTVSGHHILAIQDTTTLRDDGGGRGIVAHPVIAVDAGSGTLLGLVHAEFIFRDGGPRAPRKTRPLADKQSHRWLEGAAQAASLVAAGAASVTVIADREGDIYGAFADRPQGVDLLVRASHNRHLEAGGRLFDCTQDLEEAGRMRLSLPAAPGRRARDLTLSLRYCPVTLKRPQGRVQGPDQPETTPVYLVEAREVSPPPGIRAAHWRLLTTHPVHTPEAARTMVRYYRERWTIEQLFRVLKTKGFDIEAVRIRDERPFQKLAAACLVAAVSVLQLVRDRDGLARRPLSDVFQPDDLATLRPLSKELEGKTARQKNPHPPDTLAFAAWVCARLGGWTGYYGKPGPVVMLNGLQQFKAIQQGWSLAQHV
jgi:hypothetical protein